MSKAAKVKGQKSGESQQELFRKAPPGYRLATPEEEFEILKRGSALNQAKSTIERCDAEMRAARAEGQSAQREFAAVRAGLSELHKRLGIEGGPNDIITGPDGHMAILVDKSKREAALKLLQGGKSEESVKAVKVSDGLPPGVEDKKEAK